MQQRPRSAGYDTRKGNLPYSRKNTPTPQNDAFRMRLIEHVHKKAQSIRVFFLLRRGKDDCSGNETSAQNLENKGGPKSRKCPPQIEEVKTV